MAELKPCPFCGGKAHIDRYMQPKEEWRIMCTNCSARLGRYAGLNKKEVTYAWNNRKENQMNSVIIHRYEEPNLKKLTKNKDVDCCNCMMAEKTPLVEGGEGYLCKAALYDIKTLACFVPKEE